MAINITKIDVIWSYFSLFLLNGINILLLPFILAYLEPAEIGLWYTFTAVSGLVIILDFGLMTTLSRNVTFIWEGAEEIAVTGFKVNNKQTKTPNYNLFVKLFKATKLIYLFLGLTIFLILLTLGSYYVYSVSKNDLPVDTIMISWGFYSLAVFLNMRYAYWNPILKGSGAIKIHQQILVVTKVSQFVFSVIGILLGYGLIAVALAYLLSIIINRILAHIRFFAYQDNKLYIKPLIKNRINIKEFLTIFKTILPNAYRQGLISISNYINLRSITLISSTFLGLGVTASLGLVLQITNLVMPVANTFFNTYLPQFSSFRFQGKYKSLQTVFTKAIMINYLIIITSFISILIFGDFILDLMNSNVELLSWPYLTIIMIYMFLYNNQSIFGTFIGTNNTLPHYKAFFVSSILVLGTQLILMITSTPTLWKLILPILFIQLVYNNWKWPLVVLKE